MRSLHFRILSAVCAVCLAAAEAFAAGPGATAANFLKIPVGARAASMGGAFTAVADSADAVFYNPAGLALLKTAEASYSYNNYLPGISQQWLGAAFPSGSGAWGMGADILNVSAFDSYDVYDSRTGSVSAYDIAFYLGRAGRLETGFAPLPTAAWGVSAKYISEKLDSYTASGYGADAGLLLLTGIKGLKLGIGAENIVSSRLEFIRTGSRPAFKFKTGASCAITPRGKPFSALLSADMNFPEDGANYLSAGLEGVLYGALSLRAGYSSFGDISDGLTFGLGLGLPGRGRSLRLDYAYGSTYDLGNLHRLGLSWKFGRAPAAKRSGERSPQELRTEAAADFNRQVEALYGADPAQARAAAESLAQKNDPRAIAHFMALLSSGRAAWRATGLRGLELSGDARAPEALREVLRDPDAEMRKNAALALGRRGEREAAPFLMEALKSESSEDVKNAILEALDKLGAAAAPARTAP